MSQQRVIYSQYGSCRNNFRLSPSICLTIRFYSPHPVSPRCSTVPCHVVPSYAMPCYAMLLPTRVDLPLSCSVVSVPQQTEGWMCGWTMGVGGADCAGVDDRPGTGDRAIRAIRRMYVLYIPYRIIPYHTVLYCTRFIHPYMRTVGFRYVSVWYGCLFG